MVFHDIITSQLQVEGKFVNEKNDWWCEGDSSLARMKTTNHRWQRFGVSHIDRVFVLFSDFNRF